MRNYYLLICLVVIVSGLPAQQASFLPLQHDWNNRLLADIDSLGHTQVRPLNPFHYGEHIDRVADAYRWESPLGKDSWLTNTIFNDPALDMQETDFSLRAIPLFDISLGNDSRRTEQVYQNTRGLALQGQIGHNVAFYTDFQENQARFPLYVNEWIRDRSQRNQRVVPGQGVPKTFKSDASQYDYGVASAAVNWNLNRFFNLQFGYGKNFIGEGYRSLLLSDNAFNYPYLRIQTRFWKLQYTNIFAQLSDVNTTLEDGTYPRKYMVSHYLSVNIGKKLNIGLYENVIYGDSTSTRGLDWAYANPIIFYRPIEFAQGSSAGNVLLGLHANYRLSAKANFYGQFVLDEFKLDEFRAGDGWWGNKFGVQLGVKGQLKAPELHYRVEFNTVRPYTYAHSTALQNYGHYNQALAHPLGANFREFVAQLNYYYGRWYAEAQLNYQQQGRDDIDQHWGSNIYLNNIDREQNLGNEITQGVYTTNLITQLRAGWIVNPSYNLRLEASILHRTFDTELTNNTLIPSQTTYFQFGLRTALHNSYHDF